MTKRKAIRKNEGASPSSSSSSSSSSELELATKRTKKEEQEGGDYTSDISIDVSKMKVVALRAELQRGGLDTSGLKKDLVERLQNAIDDGLLGDYDEEKKTTMETQQDIKEEEGDTSTKLLLLSIIQMSKISKINKLFYSNKIKNNFRYFSNTPNRKDKVLVVF